MEDKPRHILQQFHEKANTLLTLMAENPDFRDLCADYDVCVRELRYWGKSTALEARERVDEYRTIALELEEEIAQLLT